MSDIKMAAELIRLAAVDDAYEQDLYDAAGPETLVSLAIEREDLPWLAPSEWLWFARWRQSMGGSLDETLLEYLTKEAASRYARFALRGLVMRDQNTNENAREAKTIENHHDTPGLQWIVRQAQEFTDSIEFANDALQYATEASFFTLRVLKSLEGQRGEDVLNHLIFLADRHDLKSPIFDRLVGEIWGE